MENQYRPRRTCLSVPGSSDKMIAKAKTLPADQVFLDGWRRASVNGPAAQKMYAAGTALDLGVKVAPKVLPTVVPQQEPHRAQSAR